MPRLLYYLPHTLTHSRQVHNAFVCHSRTQQNGGCWLRTCNEREEEEREKNRKTLVENLCKAQRKAAAGALEFKIS